MIRRREVDLRALDGVLRERGVRIAYPLLVDANESVDGLTVPVRQMQFRWVDDPAALCDHGTGIEEPPHDSPRVEAIDAIVVPALAADVRGHRLGYGAGFYDRTLPAYAPPTRTLGVVFDFQLVSELPVLPDDVACEFIVTDRRALSAAL
jgi:5-formyltetrahydrofolate cyclo-ligase